MNTEHQGKLYQVVVICLIDHEPIALWAEYLLKKQTFKIYPMQGSIKVCDMLQEYLIQGKLIHS